MYLGDNRRSLGLRLWDHIIWYSFCACFLLLLQTLLPIGPPSDGHIAMNHISLHEGDASNPMPNEPFQTITTTTKHNLAINSATNDLPERTGSLTFSHTAEALMDKGRAWIDLLLNYSIVNAFPGGARGSYYNEDSHLRGSGSYSDSDEGYLFDDHGVPFALKIHSNRGVDEGGEDLTDIPCEASGGQRCW